MSTSTPSTSPVIRFTAEETRQRIAYIRQNYTTLAQTTSFIDVAKIVQTIPDTLTEENISSIASYRIPKVSADGTCSLPNNLEPEPFPILSKCIEYEPDMAVSASSTSAALASIATSAASSTVVSSIPRLTEEQHQKRLYTLRQICLALQQALNGVEWIGIYHRLVAPMIETTESSSSSSSSSSPSIPSTATPDRLMKLAYVGTPSRPYFPLTPEFASHSNNSTVAMTRSTVIIQDVRKLAPEVPYYQCDATVRSEICVPIVAYVPNDKDNSSSVPVTLGIIDIESFTPYIFTDEYINIVLDCCDQLSRTDILLVG